MASTGTKHTAKEDVKASDAKTHKAKEKRMERDEQLATELAKFYGVEFSGKEGDKAAFIKKLAKASEERAKVTQQEDPIESARYDDKMGELRVLWAEDTGKATAQQQGLKDALAKEYPEAAISFPDENTWTLNVRGKEDSGHISAPVEAVLASASRMQSPPAS